MSLFAVLPTRAVRDPALSLTAKAVLAAVATHADPDGLAWPARGTLAAYLGVDARTVSRAFRELSAGGYLEVLPRSDDATGARRSSLLRVLYDLPAAAAARRAEAWPPAAPSPLDTSVKGAPDTGVHPPLTPMSHRTLPVEQASTATEAGADRFADEAHRLAYLTLLDRAPHRLTFEAEVRALLSGLRGTPFAPEELGAAMVDLLALQVPPSGFTLRRFAQKARASRDLPDPVPRAPGSRDVNLAALEARVAAERAARAGAPAHPTTSHPDRGTV